MNSTVDTFRLAPAPLTSGARRILLTGEPRLYLQALSELLDSIPGVSASLVQPGETGRSRDDTTPELILVGCSPASDGHGELLGSLRETYPEVPVVLLDSGTARESAERTVALNPMPRVSTGIPLGELVERLCDPTKPTGNGARRRPSRTDRHAEWPFSSLSERELSVLRLVVAGRSNEDTARALGISRHTVRTHLHNIMAKMAVRSRAELVSVAMRSGLRTATGPVAQDG